MQMRNRRQHQRGRDKDIHADEKQKAAVERDKDKDIHADEKQKTASERQGQRHTCR